MKKEKWGLSRRIEKRYSAAIVKLMKGLERELTHAKSPFEMLTILRGLARSPTVKEAARRIALSMVTAVFRDTRGTWKEAAVRGAKGRTIYRLLRHELRGNQVYKDLVKSNASYIRGIPKEIAEKMTGRVAKLHEKGMRPDSIAGELLKMYPKLSESRARLIARTEASKASTAVTESRCRKYGTSWYVWRTSEDARVRGSHGKMEGVLVSWDDPPSPEELNHEDSYGHYHAGNIFNCRCYPEPLIDYEDVTFPRKVYHRGKIQMMTLAAFKKLNGDEGH